MPPLAPDVRAAYLARLGVEAEPPSADALSLLVRRHAERVPYETLWIAVGETWGIDPHEAARRIATQSRGGYCYHLNGALGLLLTSLGYDVQAHVGGVHGPDGPSPKAVGNHLVLTVSALPTEANPAGVWYVDAGLGDALHEPLPLVAGSYLQAPFRLTLETDEHGWHLVHDPAGGFTGMNWTPDIARLADFEAQHTQLSTSPESGFVKVPMAEWRDATGVDVVRALTLLRIDERGKKREVVARRGEWFALLGDLFGLRFDGMAQEARDRLWATVVAAHARHADEE